MGFFYEQLIGQFQKFHTQGRLNPTLACMCQWMDVHAIACVLATMLSRNALGVGPRQGGGVGQARVFGNLLSQHDWLH